MSRNDDPDDRRLVDLQNQINTLKTARPASPIHSDEKSVNVGYRAGGELVGGILAGILFGYLADQMFSTQPFGLVIGAILGITAGFYGVWRATR